MEEELAVAVRVVGAERRLLVRRDVEPDEPALAVAHRRIRLGEVGLARAQRLDLCAREHEARLDLLEQVVLVPRAAILCDQLLCHAADCRVGRVGYRTRRQAALVTASAASAEAAARVEHDQDDCDDDRDDDERDDRPAQWSPPGSASLGALLLSCGHWITFLGSGPCVERGLTGQVPAVSRLIHLYEQPRPNGFLKPARARPCPRAAGYRRLRLRSGRRAGSVG